MSTLVTARLTPCSTKNVPSVTMKLGRPVRITRKPLRKPMTSATTSETRIATQTLRPYSVIRMPVDQAGGPGHGAGGQVELAADHQQRDGDRHDAERRATSKTRCWRRAGLANASVVTAKKTKMTMARDERADLRAAQDAWPAGDVRATRSSAPGGGRCLLARCCRRAHDDSSEPCRVASRAGGPAAAPGPRLSGQRVPFCGVLAGPRRRCPS